MNNIKNMMISSIGVAISAVGLTISTTQLSEIISIITSVAGLILVIITSLIIPIIKWLINAKKDGKIDSEEINELCDTIQNGIEKIDNSKNKKEGDKK